MNRMRRPSAHEEQFGDTEASPGRRVRGHSITQSAPPETSICVCPRKVKLQISSGTQHNQSDPPETSICLCP
jgi:hypothetical protein